MKLLQEGMNCMWDCMREWSRKWLLLFHPNKCKFMHIGSCSVTNDGDYMSEKITERSTEKDIEVIIANKLKFSNHLAEKAKKANKTVRLIRRTFVSLDEETFKTLYVAFLVPHLEYADQLWAPYLIKDIDVVEGVQRSWHQN